MDIKRVQRKACKSAAVLFVAWSLGCTDEQTGLFILGNVKIDAPQCTARPESGSTMISSGILDVGLRPDYEATLLIASQLTPRGDKANLRTETMMTAITGAEIHLFTDTGAPDGNPFTVPATGMVLPDSSADPGLGIVFVTLLPAATGVQLALELTNPAEIRTRVAEVTLFGKTLGGLEVETGVFTYVIQVCEGCLVDFPADALGADGTCSQPTDQAPASPCRVGQDESVDCRVCAGASEFCAFPGGPPP